MDTLKEDIMKTSIFIISAFLLSSAFVNANPLPPPDPRADMPYIIGVNLLTIVNNS